MTLDSRSAGKALSSIAEVLLEHDVIEPEGFAVLCRVAAELKAGASNVDWSTEVDPGQPILFRKVPGLCDEELVPRIIANIVVCQTDDTAEIPFAKMDIALTFSNSKGEPVSRWHIDRANPKREGFQSGPLMHMQYGGHEPGHNHILSKVSVPRWCHPPIDLALLCEIVAANLYEDKWIEFREEASWCNSISKFEQLCWTQYFCKKNVTYRNKLYNRSQQYVGE